MSSLCLCIFLLSRRLVSQVLSILTALNLHFCFLTSTLLLSAQPFHSMIFVILQIPGGAKLCRLLSSPQLFPFFLGSWSSSDKQVFNIFRDVLVFYPALLMRHQQDKVAIN